MPAANLLSSFSTRVKAMISPGERFYRNADHSRESELDMPNRPPGTCRIPGCPGLSHGGGLCDEHKAQRRVQLQRQVDAKRPTPAQRGYGPAWKKTRDDHLEKHPYCVDPYQVHGASQVLATDVDHVTPRKEGGTDDENNLQSLCHACHSRKTAREDGRWGQRHRRIWSNDDR